MLRLLSERRMGSRFRGNDGFAGAGAAAPARSKVGCALERTRDAPLPPLRTGARTACAQVRTL
jgi:hypothetical protein